MRDHVNRALEALAEGLRPYVERECAATLGPEWTRRLSDQSDRPISLDDPQFLLRTMATAWDGVFRRSLSRADRSYIFELQDVRNRWAHHDRISGDDALRALDSAERLLRDVGAEVQASTINRRRLDLQRQIYDEQARGVERRAPTIAVGGEPKANLKPWRDVVLPHPDVASGRFKQAEFAADLHQVWRDEGSDEYRDPVEFFRRTYLTEGLRDLLTNAAHRLTGQGGDPIVELQTNFGGGKTHALIALYHLASGYDASTLPGVEQLLAESSLPDVPRANIAVVVGQMIPPGGTRKSDGTQVRTLWGELGWQLSQQAQDPSLFDIVADADHRGTSPGAALTELLRRASPCLILIDEWVRYAGQLYFTSDLPAGSFDAQFTFAQALCDAAAACPQVLVVVSIPSSEIEQGGEGGRHALERLKNLVGRMARIWRAASAEESFEIVRRRLFEPVSQMSARERDAVINAFASMYRATRADYPDAVREKAYERRLQAAYPVHPELFDRLFNDWSTLEKFQRTRGVLRLMAAVIHTLWEREDHNLVILPGTVPIDDPDVRFELTRYLEESWAPVIEADVDGPQSLPVRIDTSQAQLGRYSAARRVSRTIYLGSAPHSPSLLAEGVQHARPGTLGVDDRSIKLGSVQPGEPAAHFGDALRRLASEATYLNNDGSRYWYSLRPTLTRLAEDRGAQVQEHSVDEVIVKNLRSSERACFEAVHVAPREPGDVGDEAALRLVVLGPETPHASKGESAAMEKATAILQKRGAGDRRFRNALVFVAPDASAIADLRTAVRRRLAWQSIEDDADSLELTTAQRQQTAKQLGELRGAIDQRMRDCFCWLLVPEPADPDSPTDGGVRVSPVRLTRSEGLTADTARRLSNDGSLMGAGYSGASLRLELDRYLWRGQEYVGVRQLWEDFNQYLYLPRLAGQDVLVKAIQDGVASLAWETTFAYADAYDEAQNSYRGLVMGRQPLVSLTPTSLIVRPEAARRQLEAANVGATGAGKASSGHHEVADGASGSYAPGPHGDVRPRRFFGRIRLDPLTPNRTLDQAVREVLQHIAAGDDVRVSLWLEMDVRSESGFERTVTQIVEENARTLGFDPGGTSFEPE